VQQRKQYKNGEFIVDTSLRCLVITVGLTKYFFAELDYMPALVLSTSNVHHSDDEDEKRWKYNRVDGRNNRRESVNPIGERVDEEKMSLSDDFQTRIVSSLNIDTLCNEEEGNHNDDKNTISRANVPMISTGMQYASFLSCIDFGAQIGDWISVPIIASLGITRDNHWDHLDKLVILCSIFRMARVLFLWLICPSTTRSDHHVPIPLTPSDRL